MKKSLLIIFIVALSLLFFYKVNDINYEKHNEIKKTLVNHPENLPKKDFAKATSFWFKNLKADYYWLKTVQYIWAYAYHSEYKKYLYQMADLITELNPYFESPYRVGMLLLPAYEPMYEYITEEQNNVHIDDAEKLWLKALNNFCDSKKLKLVAWEEDLIKIWNNKEYKDPCLSYSMPFYLAYIYFYYKNNPLEASKYYKIASACSDAPDWAKILSAIMTWKWWNREKSFFMFLTMASSQGKDDEVCKIVWDKLYNLGVWVFNTWEIELNWDILKDINNLRNKAFGIENENTALKATECWTNINKAVRELNLEYIERAYKKYKLTNSEPIYTAKDLYDKKYIDYLPKDYQQFKDYWIIYFLNKYTWNFDYMLWNY